MVITFNTPRNVTHTLTFLRSTGNVDVRLQRVVSSNRNSNFSRVVPTLGSIFFELKSYHRNAWIMLFSYTRIIVIFSNLPPLSLTAFPSCLWPSPKKCSSTFMYCIFSFTFFILKVFKIGIEGSIQKLRFHSGIFTLLVQSLESVYVRKHDISISEVGLSCLMWWIKFHPFFFDVILGFQAGGGKKNPTSIMCICLCEQVQTFCVFSSFLLISKK